MDETQRLSKLFGDLYDGKPWLEITLAGQLGELSAKQAAHRHGQKWNSIWEITNHIIHWRENVFERVHGKTLQTPQDNYFRPVQDTSEAAWKNTLEKLKESQRQWRDFLDAIGRETLELSYPANQMSYADHIHGILQHDAYHLGQIAMLAKHAPD